MNLHSQLQISAPSRGPGVFEWDVVPSPTENWRTIAATLCRRLLRQLRGTTAWSSYAMLALLLTLASLGAQPSPVPEYKLKAAVLFNLAKFVDWPSNALGRTERPFVLGVVGQDPFGSLLEKTLRNQTVQGIKPEVRRLTRRDDLQECHLLFISRSEREQLREILKTVSTAPVLTVSEIDEFAQLGGMVNLVLHEERVRFEINRKAVADCGLQISSKVLKYARIVDPAPSLVEDPP